MPLFITIDKMPVPERIKKKCRSEEKSTMLPYAALIFLIWQSAKYFGLDKYSTVFAIMFLLYFAAVHLAGRNSRGTIATASLIALIVSALTLRFFGDGYFLGVSVASIGFIIFWSSNRRRRDVVRAYHTDLRDWPDS